MVTPTPNRQKKKRMLCYILVAILNITFYILLTERRWCIDNTSFVAWLSLIQLNFVFPFHQWSFYADKLLVEQNSNWRKVCRVPFRWNRFRSKVRCGCCTLQAYTYVISVAYRVSPFNLHRRSFCKKLYCIVERRL